MNYFSKLPTALMSSGVMFTLLSSPLHQAHANALEQVFSEGKASVNARLRFEKVDDPVKNDPSAYTLRTRLGFTTSSDFDLTAHMDFEHVTRVGNPNYNSTQNGQTQFGVIADPMVSELNQAYLKYALPAGSFTAGRQRIILDNARFIGNVGWRQNEQTYDAIRFSLKPTDKLSLDLTNIQQVNTITAGTIEMSSNLINASYTGLPGGKLTAYTYLLDYDTAATSSSRTYGLRYKGAADKFLYTLEYAKQSDYEANPNDFKTDYLFGELGYKVGKATSLFISMETLGSDNGTTGFQTPLATKHAFNGWADKFLATPADGLQDTYLKAVSKVGGFKLVGMYHDFSADNGGADYGSGLDLLIVKPITKSIKALLKYSDYSADTFSADTQKIWLALEFNVVQ